MGRTSTGVVPCLLSLLFLMAAPKTGAQAPAPPPKSGAPEMPDWVKHTTELRASLDKIHVTFKMENIPLSEAVHSLVSLSKVNILLDDTLPLAVRNRKVTLSLQDVSLRNALASLVRPDLTFEVMYEAVCISTRAGIADQVAWAPVIPDDLMAKGRAIVEAMQRKKVSFSFQNAPLIDAIAVLSQLTDMKIVVDPAIPPKDLRMVNVSMKGVHLVSALFYVTGKDLKFAVSLGAIFISTNEGVEKEMARRALVRKRAAEKAEFGGLLATPVTGQFTRTPLNDAVAELAKLAKARIVFDPVALQTLGIKTLVTAKLDNLSLEAALASILPAKLDYSVTEEGVIVIDLKGPKRPEKPPAPAKKT